MQFQVIKLRVTMQFQLIKNKGNYAILTDKI